MARLCHSSLPRTLEGALEVDVVVLVTEANRRSYIRGVASRFFRRFDYLQTPKAVLKAIIWHSSKDVKSVWMMRYYAISTRNSSLNLFPRRSKSLLGDAVCLTNKRYVANQPKLGS